MDFIANGDWLERTFWIFALVSTILFFIRIGLMLIGSGGEDLEGLDVDVDIGDTDVAFEIFSINSLTAFFMMFGWVGLACYKQYSLSAPKSVLFALLAGVISMYITAYIFKLSKKLVSKGSSFSINDTVGKTAKVYQKINAQGRGKVQISVGGGMLREFDAVSEDKKDIESFTMVTIVKVIDNNTVSVR